MNHQERLERLQEPHGGANLRVRQRCSGQVKKHLAFFIAKAPQAHALDHRYHLRRRQPGPAGDVGQLGRPETAEVAAHKQLNPGFFGGIDRADPVVGQAV